MIAQRLTTLVAALVGAYVAASVYPPELPRPRHDPDPFTIVFECRPIVFAGRVTALCLAAFVVLSIAARIRSREWLSKAGPFEVSLASTGVEHEREHLGAKLAEAHAAVRELHTTVAALSAWRDMHVAATPSHKGADDGSP